ncbi:FtsW/RodA/SpoVE family cell cycle protein [Veillonella sp. VA139]|uniref:FtsW/RodA/SpoVE family cell cycle protein n=1 Tax=Veillonella sp. VA139 TaxID=741830 RepID=UPI000F8ED4BE|nr:putative peptidoglycan glycosyltransferase FtsW [Veillonella sp. VA139]
MQENNTSSHKKLGIFQQLRSLYKSIIKHDGQGILVPLFGIILIGFLNGYSATYTTTLHGGDNWTPFWFLLGKQALFLGVGVFVAWAFYRFDYRKWGNPKTQRYVWFIIVAAMILVFIPGIGHRANGAQRWIGFSVLTIQPSEFAKLAAMIWAAYRIDLQVKRRGMMYLVEPYHWGRYRGLGWLWKLWAFVTRILNQLWMRFRGTKGKLHPKFLLPSAFWVPLLYAVITMFQPDMGTAILILLFPAIMTLCSGYYKGHRKYFLIIFAVLAAIAYPLVANVDYRLDRVRAYYDPWSDTTVNGYQVTQSILSVAIGGFWGEGFTKGISKYNYLPEAHTDFAFSIYSQEFGFLGVCIVAVLFIWFMKYGLSIARHSRDYLGHVLAVGLTFFISIQAFFNIAMVVGLVPVTGVPLPFISYGGSSLVTNFAVIGILLNIARRNEQARKQIGTTRHLPSIGEETRHRFQPRS